MSAPASLFDRLSAALANPRELDPDAHIFDDSDFGEMERAEAAVLIAITDREEPGVILTQRPEWLRRHAGQVAFPGGRMDPEDADLTETALREAEEEVGLMREDVRVLGAVAPYNTGTGFRITPVLAVIPPDLPLVPDPHEVAEIFEVPFAWVLNPANAVERSAVFEGRERRYLDIDWQGRRIWGVTAGIIANLAQRISWP